MRRYETKTTTARQLILKPPTEDELNKNFEKLRFVANETKEKPSSAGSPKTAISQENEKEKKVKFISYILSFLNRSVTQNLYK